MGPVLLVVGPPIRKRMGADIPAEIPMTYPSAFFPTSPISLFLYEMINKCIANQLCVEKNSSLRAKEEAYGLRRRYRMSEIYQSAREIRSEVRVLPVSIVHNGIPAQKRTSAAMEEEGRKRRREMIYLSRDNSSYKSKVRYNSTRAK